MGFAERSTSSNAHIESFRKYSFSKSLLVKETTDVERKQTKRNSLVVVPNNITDVAPASEGANSLRFSKQEQPVSPLHSQQINYVDGVVSTYDEISVQCVLHINHTQAIIQLPRSLFPSDMIHGLPIRLEMMDDEGIRRPSITVREISNGSQLGISEEFDEILNGI